jgi:acyl-CoA dehydrogenase
LKYRACRDNIPVATGAMEVRGGNGYIEEWVQPRLVRDAHVGVLWEGTSNINALDIISRAVGKSGAHRALASALQARLEEAKVLPEPFRERLRVALDRAIAFAERVAADPGSEHAARLAASALYHATSAITLAWEGCQPEVDARRLLLSRFVLEHRLSTKDPLAPADDAWERDAIDLMLSDAPVTFGQAVRSLTA